MSYYSWGIIHMFEHFNHMSICAAFHWPYSYLIDFINICNEYVLMPLNDVTGKQPHRSVYNVLFTESVRTVKQYMSLFTVIQTCSYGFIPSTARHASMICLRWFCVNCTSWRILNMCSLSVAVNAGICLLIDC